MAEKKLYKSGNEKILAGVCGGIAEYYGWDPTMVRLATVLLALCGPGLVLYIAAWLVMPKNPDHNWGKKKE
ncbi:PspC domain protein [uncultured archaeon]|nr:PspC domain protein [uncultured archaeon]